MGNRERALSFIDQTIVEADRILRTLAPNSSTPSTPSPAQQTNSHDLDEREKKRSAALMRVNHTGEVCAQALYQGQALTAKLPNVRKEMEKAADEELDHLSWCAQRIDELDSHTSHLNPLFYAMSFGLGAVAGKISDKTSLGFVAATEELVCEHLENHLEKLPEQDLKSRAIVEQMLEDESRHANTALKAGGTPFPTIVKTPMRALSKVMTTLTYRI